MLLLRMHAVMHVKHHVFFHHVHLRTLRLRSDSLIIGDPLCVTGLRLLDQRNSLHNVAVLDLMLLHMGTLKVRGLRGITWVALHKRRLWITIIDVWPVSLHLRLSHSDWTLPLRLVKTALPRTTIHPWIRLTV